MSYVNTIQTQSNTYTYDQLQAMMANGTIDSSTVQNVSVFNQSADPSACTDGKDDGKLGFFEKIGSAISGAVKGVVNGVKGMFFDENGNFSLGNTLKTIATGAACLIPGVGPVIAAGLCTVGVVKGVSGVAQGISAAASATTDAEAKAAFESIGSGVLTTGLSAVGVKASVGAIAKNVANTGVVASAADDVAKMSFSKQVGTIKDGVVNSFKNSNGVIGGAKSAANTLTGNYYGTAWNSATGTTLQKAGTVLKQTAHDTGMNMVKAYDTVKEKAHNVKNKLTHKTGSKTIESLSDDIKTAHADDIKAKKDFTTNDGTRYTYNKETGKYDFAKSDATQGSTMKYETQEMSKLDETIQRKLRENGGTYTDPKTGKTYEMYDGSANSAADDLVSVGTKQTTTTTYRSYDSLSKKIRNGLDSSNNGRFTDGNTTYIKKGNQVEIVTAKNANPLLEQARATNYKGLPSSGNVFRTGITIASGNAADTTEDITESIAYQSMPMATVETQTGREYYLEDYSIMSEDEVNQAYSDIMAQSQEIQL